jgi:hypothetical protein
MYVTYNDVTNAASAEQWDKARDLALSLTKDHPNDAKSWYYLAQSDVHLGNLQEASTALHRADQLDPLHTFVGNQNSYNELRAKLAVTDATVMVKTDNDYSVSHPGEGSHPFVWGFFVLVFALFAAYVITRLIKNGAAKKATLAAEALAANAKNRVDSKLDSYGSSNRTQFAGYGNGSGRQYRDAPVSTPPRSSYTPPASVSPAAPQASTTVINNGNDGLLTGLLVGSMLSDHGHDHNTTTIIERDAPSRSNDDFDTGSSHKSSSSSWDSGSSSRDDDSDKSSSSSSWDSGSSSSSSSSSWDSGSSSSSSWDSGSSSSSYDSGSSFDSGSSSSDW